MKPEQKPGVHVERGVRADAAWAGLGPEGLRMSAAAVLRRFEALMGGKRPLAVQAPEEIRPLLEEIAVREGWRLAADGAAEALLDWGCHPVPEAGRGSRAAWVCRVGPTGPGRPDLCRGFDLVRALPFRGYVSVNGLFARASRALRLPLRASSAIAARWTRFGWDRHAGMKMARLRVAGWVESYYCQPGTAAASTGLRWGDRMREGVATFGWTGRVPLAGALLASAVTAALGWLTWPQLAGEGIWLFRAVWAAVVLASTVGCLLTETWAARHFLAEDPREFVLDETAGMAMTLLFLPAELVAASPGAVAGGFLFALLAFRAWDMVKIGARWVERTGWPGSIVWDDLLAGTYAGVASWVVVRMWV